MLTSQSPHPTSSFPGLRQDTDYLTILSTSVHQYYHSPQNYIQNT